MILLAPEDYVYVVTPDFMLAFPTAREAYRYVMSHNLTTFMIGRLD